MRMGVYLVIAAVATLPLQNPVLVTAMAPLAASAIQKTAGERPPVPLNNPGAWATTGDYPSSALQVYAEGTVKFSVTVDQMGRVTSCTIQQSSGNSALDQATCVNITRRARFNPALNSAGEPVVGKYSNSVRWQIPGMGSSASGPLLTESYPRPPQILDFRQLAIGKDDYPADALAARHEGTSVIGLDISSDGSVQTCAITTGSGYSELDAKSCEIAQKWTFDPARDATGGKAEGHTSHNVRWKLPVSTEARPSVGPLQPAINPFEKAGSVTVVQVFDEQGSRTACSVERTGEVPAIDTICKSGILDKIKPFVDEDGKPVARRVISKMSIEVESPDTEAPSSSPAQ